MARFRVSGGEKIGVYLSNARRRSPIKRILIGFFRSSTYPDGTPVTNVAAWNEFGTRPPRRLRQRITRKWWSRPRPFMRRATPAIRDRVRRVLRSVIRSGHPLKITAQVAGLIGLAGQAAIQRSIVTLRTPRNRPATVKRKKSSNPLVNIGTMKGAVTYKTESK